MTETAEATPERPASDGGRGGLKRLPARTGLYYRQVVAELRKVIWPTRKELITYTAVVMVFVTIMIAYVSVLDLGFSKAVLKIFG
ncbi:MULTISPECIES: preprotein translocase subunit SecE [Sporichthya]|uniref:Protein translocase subunit SecE n=1 Tax=Sporichthya brevicatena TaxID=171442 RepID=A0ABN1GK65_9ACTN|nr:preprotein translocase subunit SecE [Sporichthya polymorpha]